MAQHISAKQPGESRRFLLIATLILLVAFWAWTRDRTRPLVTYGSWDDIAWVSAAENYEELGLLNVHLQPYMTPYPAPREEMQVSQTNPPGPMVTIYFARRLLGPSPFSARLSAIAFTFVGAACLTALVRHVYGWRVALYALFFFSLSPLGIYFSGVTNAEPYLLPLMSLALLFYRRRAHRPSAGIPATLCVIGLIAPFYSPFWFIMLGLITLHAAIFAGFRRALRLWPVWLISLAALGLIITLGILERPDFWTTVWYGVQRRTLNYDRAVPEQPVRTMVERFLWLPTPVVTIFGLVGLWRVLRRGCSIRPDEYLIGVPGVTGLIYNLVFWQATVVVAQFIFLIVVSLCMWAGYGYFHTLTSFSRPSRAWRLLMLAFPVLFLAGSWHWTTLLRRSDEFTEAGIEWGEVAQQVTGPGEQVVTNLPLRGPHLSYFTRREVITDQPPEQITAAERPAAWGLYLFCVPAEEETPAWIVSSRISYDAVNNCSLIDLKP